MSTTTPPPADDSAVIGLAAILVDDAADVATIRPLVPGVPVMTFDEVLDDDEALDTLEEADVIAVVPGDAGSALLARANDAIRKARDVAHNVCAVVVGPWKAGTPFPTPQGIDKPGSFLAWAGSFPPLEPSSSSHQGNGKAPAATPAPPPGAVLEWGEPQPVRENLPLVTPLTADMLPAPLRGWLADIAERIGCPLDFPAVGAMITMAIIVGRRVAIRPKKCDDWTVVPNLWGAVIGRPGAMKTPALTEAMKPLSRLGCEARKRHGTEATKHLESCLVAAAQASAAKAALKQAAKEGAAPEALANLAADIQKAEAPAPPVLRSYTTSDPTVEALGELLRDNPAGVGLVRDELTGTIRTFEKPGRESDRAFYLEAWNGNGPEYSFHRIGRGHILVKNMTLSIIGGMQPGPLRNLIRDTAKGGEDDDGFLPRFQILVWPDTSATWRNVDRWPDTAAKNRAYEVFQKLDTMTAEDIGATLDENDGDDAIPHLRFSPEAQERFDAWRTILENDKLRQPDTSPMVESHLTKYRSLMPSLALLFHLADIADGAPAGPVSDTAAALAVRWCDFLEAHALRAYSSLASPDMDAARALAEKITEGALASPFSLRDVSRKCWAGLNTTEAVNRAVAALESLGWLQTVEIHDTGGRPKEEIHIHPSLPGKGTKKSDTRPDPTDKTDKSPPGPPSVSFVSDPGGGAEKKSAPAEAPAPVEWRVRL